MARTPIDPGMMRFYEELSKHSPPESASWPLDRQRSAWEGVCRMFQSPRPASITVEDIDVDGLHVRLYRPSGVGLKPGCLYFHGGGWVVGSCETHDDMVAELAEAADCVMAMPDYRLAPEHPHPAQLEDSLKLLLWMREKGSAHGIDTSRIMAAGDSAGGQMTAGLALMLRDAGIEQLRGQVLIYPVLGNDTETSSYIVNRDAPNLTRDEMLFYLESFLGPQGHRNWTDPYAVPNLAQDLSRLPPAFITVAAHDPLHDDGIIFAEKLGAAGVPVELRQEPALPHSYMRARHESAAAMQGFRAIAAALRSLAHGGQLP
jgi:acetyl esterase